VYFWFGVTNKISGDKSTNFLVLEQENGIFLSIRAIINESKNPDMIAYGMAAMGSLCHGKKNL